MASVGVGKTSIALTAAKTFGKADEPDCWLWMRNTTFSGLVTDICNESSWNKRHLKSGKELKRHLLALTLGVLKAEGKIGGQNVSHVPENITSVNHAAKRHN